MNMINAVNITDFIKNLELKYNLFESKIKDIYFWKIIRYSISSHLLIKLNGLEEGSYNLKKKSLKTKIGLFTNSVLCSLNKSALKINNRSDIIVIRSPRKILLDKEYIDIYTKPITNYFDDKSIKYELVEIEAFNVFDELNKNVHYAKKNILSRIIKEKYYDFRMTENDTEILNVISRDIYEEYEVEIEVVNITKKALVRYLIDLEYYDKLFNIVKPKELYLVCSYGLEGIISAANKNNIRVSEIQHGTISNNHMGYSFPHNTYIPYFPNKLFLFGEYWKDTTDLPINCDIDILGYPYLDYKINKVKKDKFKNKNILFLSQWTISNKLAKYAYCLASNNAEVNVIYKLHPREYNNWNISNEFLDKAQSLKNFKIINSDEISIYDLFSISEYQVGVYSTAIYEGICMGLKTILVNLPGIEHMSYLITNNFVELVNNENDLTNRIKNYSKKLIEKEYLFKSTNGIYRLKN